MIVNFKSSKSLIAGLYRDLGSNIELNESDLIEWVAEGLSLIGSYSQLEEKSTTIDIKNFKGVLPIGLVYPKDITYNGKPLMWSTKSASNNYNCPECNNIPTCCEEHNFYISDGCINTNLEEGVLCIVYLATPLDDEGFPLIPDNVYFDKALKSYVTYMLDRIQYRRGLIPKDIYKDSEKDWLFYVNSARGSANMLNSAQMERLKNIWVRLIPKQNEFKNNFSNLETNEKRKLY